MDSFLEEIKRCVLGCSYRHMVPYILSIPENKRRESRVLEDTVSLVSPM